MDKWVITYNGIDSKDILMNEDETIEGKKAIVKESYEPQRIGGE